MFFMDAQDHDLLVTVHEQVKQVRIDIKEIKDGTATKLLDHETRIRRLETWGFMAIGALCFVQFIIGVYLTLHKSQ